jgi:hypothetical protein
MAVEFRSVLIYTYTSPSVGLPNSGMGARRSVLQDWWPESHLR